MKYIIVGYEPGQTKHMHLDLNHILSTIGYAINEGYCISENKKKYLDLVRLTKTEFLILGERTGLMVRASDSGSGDPVSILGRVGVLVP